MCKQYRKATNYNTIKVNQFIIDISANLTSTLNVTNLGSITNIVNNNGTLIFLFNNNTLYKLVNNIMKIIIITAINYSGIVIANNNLYGIIYDGVDITANILLNVYNL